MVRHEWREFHASKVGQSGPIRLNGDGPATVAIVRRQNIRGLLHDLFPPFRGLEGKAAARGEAAAYKKAGCATADVNFANHHLAAAIGTFHKLMFV